jgi:hypothetical protein
MESEPVRDGDDADVVGHEAIAEIREFGVASFLAEQVEVDAAVFVGEEDGAAGVAALGDVVGRVERDDSGEACQQMGGQWWRKFSTGGDVVTSAVELLPTEHRGVCGQLAASDMVRVGSVKDFV